MRSSFVLAATALVLVACGGSVPPPNDQFAAAEKDVGRAQEGGAANVPDAKLHLQLAQENLGQAKGFIAKDSSKDNERAASLIARADAESDLALQIARVATLQGQAAQAHAMMTNPGAQPPPVTAATTGTISTTATTTTTSATVGAKIK